MSHLKKLFGEELLTLHHLHFSKCHNYRQIINSLYPNWECPGASREIPPLPVRFLKEFDLVSVPHSEIYRVMKSSGTTGKKSQIYLDRKTAVAQQRALLDLGKGVLGEKKQPMLVLDSTSILGLNNDFSARAAGVNGFKLFSHNSCFILSDDGDISTPAIEEFQAHPKFFAFGFTWVMWTILRRLDEMGVRFRGNPDVVVIHGGGWKKLEKERVTKAELDAVVERIFGCNAKAVDYYGMIEQTGSIYFQCPAGFFHDSSYGSVYVRSPEDLGILNDGQLGIIQVNSTLPTSYPGHCLLTEDIGRRWEDVCECGSAIPRFKVEGRLQQAEIRGCSDAL